MRYLIITLTILIIVSVIPLHAKSASKAMLMSAILPGSGQIYAGNLTKGIAFITADMIILYSANRFSNEVQWQQSSYKKYALSHANIVPEHDANYYALLQEWYSSEDYNNYYEMLARNYYLIYNYSPDDFDAYVAAHSYTGDAGWQWQTDKDWKQYKKIRKEKQINLMNQKLAIGTAIANRIISALDATITVKRQNRNLNASINLYPDFEKNGAILNCSVEF